MTQKLKGSKSEGCAQRFFAPSCCRNPKTPAKLEQKLQGQKKCSLLTPFFQLLRQLVLDLATFVSIFASFVLSLQLLRIIFHVFQFFSQRFFKFPGGPFSMKFLVHRMLAVGPWAPEPCPSGQQPHYNWKLFLRERTQN